MPPPRIPRAILKNMIAEARAVVSADKRAAKKKGLGLTDRIIKRADSNISYPALREEFVAARHVARVFNNSEYYEAWYKMRVYGDLPDNDSMWKRLAVQFARRTAADPGDLDGRLAAIELVDFLNRARVEAGYIYEDTRHNDEQKDITSTADSFLRGARHLTERIWADEYTNPPALAEDISGWLEAFHAWSEKPEVHGRLQTETIEALGVLPDPKKLSLIREPLPSGPIKGDAGEDITVDGSFPLMGMGSRFSAHLSWMMGAVVYVDRYHFGEEGAYGPVKPKTIIKTIQRLADAGIVDLLGTSDVEIAGRKQRLMHMKFYSPDRWLDITDNEIKLKRQVSCKPQDLIDSATILVLKMAQAGYKCYDLQGFFNPSTGEVRPAQFRSMERLYPSIFDSIRHGKKIRKIPCHIIENQVLSLLYWSHTLDVTDKRGQTDARERIAKKTAEWLRQNKKGDVIVLGMPASVASDDSIKPDGAAEGFADGMLNGEADTETGPTAPLPQPPVLLSSLFTIGFNAFVKF